MDIKLKVGAFIAAVGLLFSCSTPDSTPATGSKDQQPAALMAGAGNPILYRFAITGCNRLDRHDTTQARLLSGDASTANTFVLQRTLNELAQMTPTPNAFFFMGDMVVGESNLQDLDRQLSVWTQDLQSNNYSKFPNSKIQLVAIPGNHEFLAFEKSCPKGEYPLNGALNVWNKYITAPYFIPANRTDLGSANFSFTQQIPGTTDKIAFMVLNTDTYDNPTPANPCAGKEGYIPYAAIQKQAQALQSDPTIKYKFVLGHKPASVDINFGGSSHDIFQNSKQVFQDFNGWGYLAMLSAHKHYYDEFIPTGSNMPQVIVGNGGSPLDHGGIIDDAYGYAIVDIYANSVVLTPMTFPLGSPNYYNQPVGATTAGTPVKLK